MYDRVDYECNCPDCGAKMTDWQTKDGELMADKMQVSEVNNFYGMCPYCMKLVEFTRNDVDGNSFDRVVSGFSGYTKSYTESFPEYNTVVDIKDAKKSDPKLVLALVRELIKSIREDAEHLRFAKANHAEELIKNIK